MTRRAREHDDWDRVTAGAGPSQAHFTEPAPQTVLSWALGDKPKHTVCSFSLQGFVEITFCRQASQAQGEFCAETMAAFTL